MGVAGRPVLKSGWHSFRWEQFGFDRCSLSQGWQAGSVGQPGRASLTNLMFSSYTWAVQSSYNFLILLESQIMCRHSGESRNP